MIKSLVLSLAAAAVISAAASANPVIVTERHTKVAYGDLDLSKEAGVAVLMERLQVASHKVCGVAPDEHSSKFDVNSYDSCTKGALKEAVAKLKGKLPVRYVTAEK